MNVCLEFVTDLGGISCVHLEKIPVKRNSNFERFTRTLSNSITRYNVIVTHTLTWVARVSCIYKESIGHYCGYVHVRRMSLLSLIQYILPI